MAKSADSPQNDHTLRGQSSEPAAENGFDEKEDFDPTLSAPGDTAGEVDLPDQTLVGQPSSDNTSKQNDSPTNDHTERIGSEIEQGEQASSYDATLLGDSDAQNMNAIDRPAEVSRDVTRVGSSVKHPKQSGKVRITSPDPGYEIISTLGRGGMGVVYKARQKKLNRFVALKMILAGSHAGSDALARFQTEAEAVAKLQHPNIVQIYEVGESNGQPFFTLEFLDGGTLQQKFDGTPMKPKHAAEMIQTLARAVHYAHQRDIIHRDLKPANVLLSKEGTPKIADFGLAKDLGENSQQTGTGAIIGTPSYMAPEQASGIAQDIGPAVDTYALGALLYEALTGRPPFRCETVMETLHQVQNIDPVPPRRLVQKIDKDLETICLKCLQKEPQRRYGDAEELADDLQRYLSNKPIKARPVSLFGRACKWAKRRPAVAALLAILAVVLVGGFFATTTLWLRAEMLRGRADDAMHTAKQNAKRADDNAKHAEEEMHKAEKAKSLAVAAEQLAQKRYHQSLRSFYVASMNLAQSAFQQGQKGRLGELMFNKQLDHKDLLKLRGFEFKYLNRLFQSDRLVLKEHIMYVTDVAFRPRFPSIFATASANGTIILWDTDAHKGKMYRMLAGHKNPVRSIAFHPKQNLLASASEDGAIRIWRLDDPKQKPVTLAGHTDWVTSIAFSPDGESLFSGSEDGTVRLWNWQQQKTVATLRGHDYGVTDVAFGPNGRYAASAGLDKTVVVWDLRAGKQFLRFNRHQHWVTSVTFAPARDLVASASWDKSVKVWDATTGQELLDLAGCPSPVRSLSFSPDGFRLAASCIDQTVVVWDLATKKLVRKLDGKPGMIRSVAFSEDGQRLASINFDMLSQIVPNLNDVDCSVLQIGFDPKGKRIAAAGDNKTVYVWQLDKSSAPVRLQGHSGPVRAVAFHPKENQLATAGEDNQIILWNMQSAGIAEKTLTGHKKWVTSLAYGPNGKWLVSGSADQTVRTWNLDGKSETWKGHTGAVLAVAVNSDGTLVASAGADGRVIIWDGRTGVKKAIYEKAHDGLVTAVQFSPDGKLLASAGSDNVVKLWELDSETPKLVLRGHTQKVTCLHFHPDGNRLATGSKDRTIKIWDVATGFETLTLKKHEFGVTSVAFRPDGRTLATAGWDKAIYLWQTAK